MKLFVRSVVLASVATFIAIAAGCGDDGSTFGDGAAANKNDGGNVPPGQFGGGDDAGIEQEKPCTNLCLKQKTCAGVATTSISGTVMDPAGRLPIYNALVYIPNAAVGPLTEGAVCDRCGKVSGDPLVSTLTKVDGTFKLDDVPVGTEFPLVIQIGKWRRQITLPAVPECVNTAVTDLDKLRLPKKKSEGDIPLIALTTGGLDVMECWLRKIGIDDSEFTTGTGDGRVHLYKGGGPGTAPPTDAFDATHNGGASFSSATDLWSNADNLKKYDMVILSCEGQLGAASKPPAALQAMKDYGNAGGRIFATHWHRYWFSTAARDEGPGSQEDAGAQASPFDPVATWTDHADPLDPSYATVNTKLPNGDAFPKGQAMFDWLNLDAVGGLIPDGSDGISKMPIDDPRDNVDSVMDGKALSWLTVPASGGGRKAHEFVTWNMPVGAADDQVCGRVVYSDVHVTTDDTHDPWPSGCSNVELKQQEKALEFMLFDLSSCVQNDAKPPKPPVN